MSKRITRGMRLLCFSAAITTVAGNAIADDTADATSRLGDAIRVFANARDAPLEGRLALYSDTIAILDEIIADYPTTDLAAKLKDDRQVGGLRYSDLEERLELLMERRTLLNVLEDTNSRADLLARQLKALREQIAVINEAFETSEARNEEQQRQISDLGRRLNVALASKVEELSRYRSEFFGRLREILGDQGDIVVVGDRFAFQSELLFAPGRIALDESGQDRLRRVGKTLVQIAERIPEDIDWILRVDGHTDRRPIRSSRFPSNWELSAARAISVVKFLVAQGIPPERVAAAGFAEYQPLDDRDDEISFRRNRRVEFRLTQR